MRSAYIFALSVGVTAGVLEAGERRKKALKERLTILQTKWKLTTEELNMAYQLLDEDQKQLVLDRFQSNDTYLRVLFKNLGD